MKALTTSVVLLLASTVATIGLADTLHDSDRQIHTPDQAAYQARTLAALSSPASSDPRASSGGRWVPGPVALELMQRGMPATEAMSAARAHGEHAQYLPLDLALARQMLQARQWPSASELQLAVAEALASRR